ncbi:hypothetical protein [Mangrovibacterium diazotrophicum]|uniref:Uncharacterized protein n=1 Tax=Mangrovibacterium diazotrophicum TaxID=1261403 RepID=A0A419VW76_9BACT|nr:hypothetical protein [Mangrovibacterium diazotrophicum]RKD86395.1 hypothetical protein BC643_4086 [Mangrovibacterium diazotrophicum]
MNHNKPNYMDLGFADKMGPKLKNEVEKQLLNDLKFYGVDKPDLKFDWSESCIEGHDTNVLDGKVENFSGISVFDNMENLVAEGWMEFIHNENLFLVYWEFVTTWSGDKKLNEKKEIGLPNHIWVKLPNDLKIKYKTK